jgi:cellulose synthase/poly-beta-1,6-N-acetylglucosamine synthase-like glycosyltransferase
MVLFWVSLSLIGYSWFVFPVLLLLLVRVAPRRAKTLPPVVLPSVTVAVAAWNEKSSIGEKLRNTLDLDYPRDRLEILVGSDGSDDGTDEIVLACGDPRVRLLRLKERSGKPAVLNLLLREVRGDAVLFTDADVLLEHRSLSRMVARLSDPRVGAVHAHYSRLNVDGHPAEGLFDRYESWLKDLEGRLGAMVGAYGWALLVRTSLCAPLPVDTVLDDALIGARPFRRGYAVVYERSAKCWTRVESETLEFRRRVRIARGSVQFFVRNRDLLLPRHGVRAWVLFSHKLLRLIGPLLLLLVFLTSIAMSGRLFFLCAVAVQVLLWGTVPLVPRASGKWRRLLFVQYYLYTNVALAAGYWEFLFGRGAARYWERTQRK